MHNWFFHVFFAAKLHIIQLSCNQTGKEYTNPKVSMWVLLSNRHIKPWNNVNFAIIFIFVFIFLWLRHVLTQSIIIFATKIDNDMSKQVEQMRRMLLILNNIKKRQRISKQELLSRVNDSLYYIYGYKEIGVRTLERDLEDIESMFCVSITYDRSNN